MGDNKAWEYTITGMQALLVISILFGNSLTIAVFARFQYLRTITNKFVVSLAISDIMVGIAISLNVVNNVLIALWTHKFACIGLIFISLTAIMLSIFSLVAISVDRYIAIVYPLHYSNLMTPKRSNAIIAVVWIWCFLAPGPIIFWNNWENRTITDQCIFTDVAYSDYIFAFALGPFFVLSVGLITLYAVIFKEVRRHKIQIQTQMYQVAGTSSIMKEWKTTITMAIVIALFLVCWMPYNITTFVIIIDSNMYNGTVFSVTYIMAILNSILNPIIYGWKNKKFRRAFRVQLHLQSAHVDEF